MTLALVLAATLLMCAWVFWRFYWFYRDPLRHPPAAPGIVSPADGTVVYVKRAAPGEDVVVIKRGLAARIADIVKEDVRSPKVVIGIFMSPFDVHYNRVPLAGRISMIRSHPGSGRNAHMGPMHWRSVLGVSPRYRNSVHIVSNERTVTRIEGTYEARPLPYYIVQIGARTVGGIEVFGRVGDHVVRGAKFGIIRIGSQVDLVLPDDPTLQVRVEPGQKVRAGETILVD
ncbi:MAG: phosphatidylserine decarboxylase [Burkholderiaceae bacterium]|nr:phosphatidylserine decarboxylase [Burkholderiaceae bacterium]